MNHFITYESLSVEVRCSKDTFNNLTTVSADDRIITFHVICYGYTVTLCFVMAHNGDIGWLKYKYFMFLSMFCSCRMTMSVPGMTLKVLMKVSLVLRSLLHFFFS